MRTVPWVLLLCVLKSRLASPAILLDENTAFICDFETQPDGNSSTEWCGLGQNPSASGISWQRSNRTQTVGSTTLPQFDHTFNDPAFPGGTFLYLGTGSADESLAWTPKFQLNAYDRLACVSFYYQWFSEGEPLFKLSYMVNETAGSWESHSLDLTPSRSWTKTDFELRPSDQFSIVFLANLSGNGTFAVDDLTIYECYSSGDPPPGRPLPADPASTPGCNNQAFDLGTLVTESSGSRNFTNNINYPYGDYAESAQCRWFLRTGPQEAMKLTFHDLSMETPLDEKDGCNYDFLNIYEVSAVDYERVLREKPCSGALRQYPYKGPICVLDKHPQVHTASTSYVVPGCGNASGMQSNNPAHATQFYPPGRATDICLKAADTVIEFCSDYTSNYRGFYATFDIVARDSTVPSPSPSPVVLQASLQGSATDQVVSSPVNNATKKYDPDTRASWRIEAQECLKIKLLFVDAKNTEIRCSVRRLGLRKAICVGVEAGSPSGCQNHTIAVSFPMFKLEGGHGCPYDRVTVYDGQDKAAPILDTFCGFDRQPRRVVSTGSVAFVEFVSDSWLQHPGFTMKYESIPCGGYEFQCASRVQCVPASQVCNGHRDCGDGSDETSCGFLCGITAVSPNSQTHRIVGGREAKRNSWPWQVALLWDIGDQFCGGVLIHPFYVMTAAHCVDKIDIHRMVLRFAAHDVTAEEPLTEDVLIETAVVHPGYDKLTHQNDIALLKLQKPAMFRREVLPACLARANQDVPVDTMCTATGWGDTTGYFGRGGIIAPPSRIVHRVDDEVKPNVLKEVSLPIVSQESCRLAYGPALTEDMLCAGYREGGKDSCQGDSGGPLVCRQDDKWVLHGIVSWGEGSCASPGIPGIYARVSHFAEWIENTMARLSHSPGNVSSLT